MGAPAPVVDAGGASCDAGSCSPLTCEPGARRCNGGTLEECGADRQSWIVQDTCANTCLCLLSLDAASCISPDCQPGQARCAGSELQVCNGCQTGYDLIADCGTAEACNVETLSCDGGAEEPALPGADAGVP